MTTAKGFKLLRQARLVSEKIFYDNEGRGWIVQFIDRPLVGLLQEGQGSSAAPGSPGANRSDIPRPTNSPPIDQQQGTDKQESTRVSRRNRQRSGLFHATVPYRETRRNNKARPLLTLQLALQRFPGVFQSLEKLIMDFNDAIMTKGSLEEIRSAVDRLLAVSVHVRAVTFVQFVKCAYPCNGQCQLLISPRFHYIYLVVESSGPTSSLCITGRIWSNGRHSRPAPGEPHHELDIRHCLFQDHLTPEAARLGAGRSNTGTAGACLFPVDFTIECKGILIEDII